MALFASKSSVLVRVSSSRADFRSRTANVRSRSACSLSPLSILSLASRSAIAASEWPLREAEPRGRGLAADDGNGDEAEPPAPSPRLRRAAAEGTTGLPRRSADGTPRVEGTPVGEGARTALSLAGVSCTPTPTPPPPPPLPASPVLSSSPPPSSLHRRRPPPRLAHGGVPLLPLLLASGGPAISSGCGSRSIRNASRSAIPAQLG